MKKDYQKPQMVVVPLKMRKSLLVGSMTSNKPAEDMSETEGLWD